MDVTEALLRYWRNSLADADLRSPGIADGFKLTERELQEGKLSEQNAQAIFLFAGQERRKRKDRQKEGHRTEEPLEQVQILLAPYRLRRPVRHGKAESQDTSPHHPLWIPAEVAKDGTLHASTAHLPWMVRDHLEPAFGNKPTVGSLDDYDAFLTGQGGPLGNREWKEADKSTHQKAVPGPAPWRGLPERMENEDYVARAEPFYLDKARGALGGEAIETVEAAVARLHQELQAGRSRLDGALGANKGSSRLREKLFSLLFFVWKLLGRWLSQPSPEEAGTIQDSLDCADRHRLFLLAARYWEGRWLLEMNRLLADPESLKRQSRAACEKRLRRLAMLTPCMVATFYQAPKVVESFDRDRGGAVPMLETIDLLLVDEAGQTAPEVGAAVFALARRALVVGDVHQIEPVWNIPALLDKANRRKAGLEPDDPDDEDSFAHHASRGSVMFLARRATAFTRPDDRGLLLREHRRCVPEIVRYCNELVYRGRLQPLRPAKKDRVLPPLGWAHISSGSDSERGSRTNRGQARAIARWLASRRQELQDGYNGLPLRDVVAVITPFSAQNRVLREELETLDLDVEAGTVHTFQGGEVPVVLFSTVYSARPQRPSSLFFDRGVNLLNVAVSRAKDSFLVFGDMELLDPASGSPSGRLARLLFESPDNEITGVQAVPDLVDQLKDSRATRQISSLEGHREILRRTLAESRTQVLIVSPFLTRPAIEADGIPAAVAEARRRGVQIRIVYSRDLSWNQEYASRVADTLRESGAEVIAGKRIHSKILIADDAWHVVGSFNWLSAQRDQTSPYHRYDTSLWCQGPEALELIERTRQEIDELLTPAPARPYRR